MIRAMIGTVAVLAGFAVVERSVDASTGQAGSCTPTDAHALLPQDETVPMRSAPALDSPAIGMLRGGTAVSLSGSQGGWARISVVDESQRFGWVPADQLKVNAKVGSALYSRPGPMGDRLAVLDGVSSFRVLGCRGSWLQVINARHGAGWIDR